MHAGVNKSVFEIENSIWPFFKSCAVVIIFYKSISRWQINLSRCPFFLAVHFILIRRSHRGCSVRKGVYRNIAKLTEKHLCQSLFLIKLQAEACNFIKKETLAQVFSCEFSEISKSIFFTEHLRWLLLTNFLFNGFPFYGHFRVKNLIKVLPSSPF